MRKTATAVIATLSLLAAVPGQAAQRLGVPVMSEIEPCGQSYRMSSHREGRTRRRPRHQSRGTKDFQDHGGTEPSGRRSSAAVIPEG